MTTQQLTAIRNDLMIENHRLRGGDGTRHPAAYECSTYQINATVHPKSKIVLDGHRPDYDARSGSRGPGRHEISPFRVEFKIGDQAVYHGFNFCYFGTIKSIGPKTVTIVEHGDRAKRLTIERFAFWNRQDVRFVNDERAGWSD